MIKISSDPQLFVNRKAKKKMSYLTNLLLLEQGRLYISTELLAAFHYIPGSTYKATIESASIGSTIDFLNRVLFTPPTVPDAAAHATWADVTGSIRNYRDPILLLNLSVQKPSKTTES
jgi:hypothetical protein